jgi:hypothetical protein
VAWEALPPLDRAAGVICSLCFFESFLEGWLPFAMPSWGLLPAGSACLKRICDYSGMFGEPLPPASGAMQRFIDFQVIFFPGFVPVPYRFLLSCKSVSSPEV